MKLLGILIVCALAAGAASSNTCLIRDADVYPVTGAPDERRVTCWCWMERSPRLA